MTVIDVADERLHVFPDVSTGPTAPVALGNYIIGGGELWQPLYVSLRRAMDVDQYIAEALDDASLVGVGQTAAEAIEDLRAALLEYRETLEALGDQLADVHQEQLAFLRLHVRPLPVA